MKDLESLFEQKKEIKITQNSKLFKLKSVSELVPLPCIVCSHSKYMVPRGQIMKLGIAAKGLSVAFIEIFNNGKVQLGSYINNDSLLYCTFFDSPCMLK